MLDDAKVSLLVETRLRNLGCSTCSLEIRILCGVVETRLRNLGCSICSFEIRILCGVVETRLRILIGAVERRLRILIGAVERRLRILIGAVERRLRNLGCSVCSLETRCVTCLSCIISLPNIFYVNEHKNIATCFVT
ncbi:MAG TPA: hypothetical protein EYH35_05495 [Thiotrichaceae bacterium]|nr:hypothetical protein [Thiotrichaceae bacterium]